MLKLLAIIILAFTGLASPALGNLVFEKQNIEATSGVQDMKMDFLFPFTNKSDKPVKIKAVKTSCPCLTAYMENNIVDIPAGGKGKVGLKIDLGAFGAMVEKDAVVETSTGQTIPLKLKVKVPEFVRLEPKTLKWKKGEALTPKTIKIKIDPELTLHLKDVSISLNQFDFEPKTIKEGKEYSITVTPKTTAEPALARLLITTDSSSPRYKKCIGFLSIDEEEKK